MRQHCRNKKKIQWHECWPTSQWTVQEIPGLQSRTGGTWMCDISYDVGWNKCNTTSNILCFGTSGEMKQWKDNTSLMFPVSIIDVAECRCYRKRHEAASFVCRQYVWVCQLPNQIFTAYEAHVGKVTHCGISLERDKWRRLHLQQVYPLMNKLDGIYITPTFTITFTITLDIMQSNTSKSKDISSTSHTSAKHTPANLEPDHPRTNRTPKQIPKRRSHRSFRSPQDMFCYALAGA